MRPNIVIFNPDQWRGDVMGHLGNAAACTPNLDRLVETDAVSFSRAFCQNPVCTPSRCSFMTGWYPHVRGHRTMNHPLQPGEPCLLAELRRAGYEVWWGGKNDLVSDPAFYGNCVDHRNRVKPVHEDLHRDLSWRKMIAGRKDRSFFAGRLETLPGEARYLDADWCQVMDACAYLRNRPDDGRPFCLYLPLLYPHPPYGVEDPYFSAIDRAKLPPRIRGGALEGKPRMMGMLRAALELQDRDETWWNELRATYYGMCARVDAQAGLVLDALRESGVYDDTAFFFFSDHGDYAGDYDLVEKAQNLFEDCLVRVPFLLKPPAAESCRPGVRNALVELVDFPATVYDLAGISPDYSHFGKSLRHLLAGDARHREAVFCEGGRLADEAHCGESGSDHPDDLYAPRVWLQRGDPVAHGKAVMCRDSRGKLVSRLSEADEYYDLEKDPGETRNAIDDPSCAGEISRLCALTARFLLETTDVVPHQIFPRDCKADPEPFPGRPG
jgi:arylsulfatase A-like enzyme